MWQRTQHMQKLRDVEEKVMEGDYGCLGDGAEPVPWQGWAPEGGCGHGESGWSARVWNVQA